MLLRHRVCDGGGVAAAAAPADSTVRAGVRARWRYEMCGRRADAIAVLQWQQMKVLWFFPYASSSSFFFYPGCVPNDLVMEKYMRDAESPANGHRSVAMAAASAV